MKLFFNLKKNSLSFQDFKWLFQRRILISGEGSYRHKKEHFLPYADGLQNLMLRAGKGAHGGWSVWRRLAKHFLLVTFPSGKLSDTSRPVARLHVATEKHVMSSHRKLRTNMPTLFGKIKGPLLSFIFLAANLTGSQAATCGSLFVCTGIGRVYQLG